MAWNPAIVVTDLKMPRMDGIELLSKLTEEGSGLNANLTVVVLTAMGSIELAVDAMKLGAYDFLEKPVDATRLRTILANAMRQRETQIELEVVRRRLRETGVMGGAGGQFSSHAAALQADRADRALECLGAHHRRERHGQGAGGAHAARAESAQVLISSRPSELVLRSPLPLAALRILLRLSSVQTSTLRLMILSNCGETLWQSAGPFTGPIRIPYASFQRFGVPSVFSNLLKIRRLSLS